MNEFDKINKMLFIIETDLSDERLKDKIFYTKLFRLFESVTKTVNTGAYSYYDVYDKLNEYKEWLGYYSNILFKENICPDDDLTGIFDFLDRFLRHNPPYFKVETPTVIDLMDNQKENGLQKNNHTSRKNPKTTYQWQGNPKELPELYSLMIDKQLIAPDTTLEQVKAIFTGQPVDDIEPVKWNQDNKSELLYFILKLKETNNIKNSKRFDYRKMTACFVLPNGKPFKGSFKQIKSNIDINLSDDKQKAINELVNQFT